MRLILAAIPRRRAALFIAYPPLKALTIACTRRGRYALKGAHDQVLPRAATQQSTAKRIPIKIGLRSWGLKGISCASEPTRNRWSGCGVVNSSILLAVLLRGLDQRMSEQGDQCLYAPIAVRTISSATPQLSGASSRRNGSLPAHSGSRPTATSATDPAASHGCR